jgi:hypothetical protein
MRPKLNPIHVTLPSKHSAPAFVYMPAVPQMQNHPATSLFDTYRAAFEAAQANAASAGESRFQRLFAPSTN